MKTHQYWGKKIENKKSIVSLHTTDWIPLVYTFIRACSLCLFLPGLVWKWQIKGSRCTSVCRSVSVCYVFVCTEANCGLMSCRRPALQALSGVSGSLWRWPFTGKMAQREQSHLHWHFCHHLWLCQQASHQLTLPQQTVDVLQSQHVHTDA